MGRKKEIIKKQGQELDRLECENIALKRKLKDSTEEITRLRNSLTEARLECIDYGNVSKKLIKTEEEKLQLERILNGHKSVLAEVREELDRANKVNEHLKQQCKEMHRAKASAIGWKREAYRVGAKFDAVMATYAQSEEHNMALSQSLERACGKLDVFERVLSGVKEEIAETPEREVSANETACNDSGEAVTAASE